MNCTYPIVNPNTLPACYARLDHGTLSRIAMGKAWAIRKHAAMVHNIPVLSIHFGACLKLAWKRVKRSIVNGIYWINLYDCQDRTEAATDSTFKIAAGAFFATLFFLACMVGILEVILSLPPEGIPVSTVGPVLVDTWHGIESLIVGAL